MTAPVLALAMIPPLQFDGWQWFSLVLTTIVVGWGGLPFHRAALTSVRHGAATMDTLISVGTLAALGWSVVAMLFLGAGGLDYRMSYEWTLGAGGSSDDIYLEVAAVVTTFVLDRTLLRVAGEAAGRGGAAGAARAGRQGGLADRGRARAAGAGRSSCGSATCSLCGRASGWRPTAWWSRAGRRSTGHC